MEYYIHLTYSIFIFMTGLMFGSFFTLATYRIPRKIDIVKSRSYCPNCKHKLGFFDCFPILSYVSTLGRCRYCKRPISIRYPLIELASGFAFLIPYLFFGFSWQFFALLVAYIYGVLVIGVDVMRYKMTDEEKEEVKRQTEERKQKKNKKAGALNSELLVAIAVFVLFFVSAVYTMKNYYSVLSTYTKKSEALNICINNINNAKTKKISELATTEGSTVINNTSYNYKIVVSDYKKANTTVVSNAKVIESVVTFTTAGNEDQIKLKYIKVE